MLFIFYEAIRGSLSGLWLGSMLGILDQVEFRALGAAFVAFFLVLFTGRGVIARLRRLKIGDTGLTDAEALRAHTASKANTPTMGGILIVGAILASTILLADVRVFYVQLAAVVVVWLAVLGGVDDWLKLTAARRGSRSRQGLYAWEKLIFQLGLGILVGIFAYGRGDNPQLEHDLAHVLNIPFQKTYQSVAGGLNESLIFLRPIEFVVLTMLMVSGVSNAVNIADGMDGLATGIAGAVSLGLIALTLLAGHQPAAQYLLVPYVDGAHELAVVSGAMLGACLGFLWWNCSPAQVFMGDTGSLCLGGLIAYIATIVRQEVVILLMCGVFLLEIASVVLQVGYFKASGGKRIFRCAPYHHHLHLAGWTEQQVVARFWIISVILVVAALASIKMR